MIEKQIQVTMVENHCGPILPRIINILRYDISRAERFAGMKVMKEYLHA